MSRRLWVDIEDKKSAAIGDLSAQGHDEIGLFKFRN